ncbi:ATP-dependent DNA helicase RecQ [Clostridia bacterium]|nr:ATP-dependent DNA helicase RecQ [Clostridia bacterium]
MTKEEILKQYFGYDSFREGQEQLIDSVLSGCDCLGVMPTGAGKSVCFQIPALMQSGVTLVISPLISLMKDQVNSLTQAGIKAAFINSSLSDKQISLVLSNARNGVYKIIYVAPERLGGYEFIRLAQSVEISILTVDEAHCISQWGQDFRPSYLKIADFLNALPKRPIVSAFTATATHQVREDIINSLGLDNPYVLVTGFDRKNLSFSVSKPKDKFTALIKFLAKKQGKTGIIYCLTRTNVDKVCHKLNRAGYSALSYHAGLSDKERRDNQDAFLYDRAKIMVATNAFGMGIDKSNVNFVVHYNMPKNVESYYQEAGRAGRDGEPADCVLFYSGQDVRTNIFLIENGNDMAEVEEWVKDRERAKLKNMISYCHTNECLRAYILKYFGEKAKGFCGNCSNCTGKSEEVDITIEAQKILSCVIKSGERYGAGVIIDILLGNKTEKVAFNRLDTLSTFGISESSDKTIREIINFLTADGYLSVAEGQYPILRRGAKYKEVLQKDAILTMKLTKRETASRKPNNKVSTANKGLLEKLKKLRLEIANEQNLPAYIVFADSALTDMCLKLPANEEEFLLVSGVGQVKLERYGRRFIAAINDEDGDTDGDGENEDDIADSETPSAVEIKVSNELVTISVIADRINCMRIQKGIVKISGQKINDWLVLQDYLEKVERDGKSVKIVTELGTKLGITTEERTIRNEMCFINHYDKNAQTFIVENCTDI